MATKTSTHTEVPSKKGFPPFEKETFASQLFWLALTFVALYLLISRIAVPRIGGILEERSKRIEGDFAAAQRMKGESEAALAAYEKSLAEARNRAQAIGNEARDKAQQEGEERRKAQEAQLNADLAAAEKQIAATKSAAMANVRGIAVEAAGAIVERLIGTVPAAPAVAAAVDQALKR
jgi:F-type H+-transporting ATPase subunit b